MIRFATTKDKPAIKKLWHTSFQDDESYVDFYLKNCFATNQCLLLSKNNEICSMLFLIDCEINGFSGKYIYAACTEEKFRHQGYMGQLLEAVKSNLNTEYDFVCLVPASDSLYNYYSKFGYKNFFYNSVTEFQNTNERVTLQCRDISFDEFNELRNNFYGQNILKWSDNALNYAFDENLFTGGRNIEIPGGYAIINENSDICNVLEWGSRDFKINDFTQITKCGKIIVRTFSNENAHCNGLILTNLNIQKTVFLSLVLD